jgi:hypothetical protein
MRVSASSRALTDGQRGRIRREAALGGAQPARCGRRGRRRAIARQLA